MSIKPDDIVGVWTLEDTYVEDDEGNRTPTLGKDPKGRIIYTPDGYMVALTEKNGRKPLSVNASDNEKAAAFDSCMTYSGKWTLKNNIVTHEIDTGSNPIWVGTKRDRKIDYQGDHMTFTGLLDDGITTAVIIWRRS
jgi:hypothetical protein|tara:strand:+ start:2819 stop:3229 length:411 start_codon:yes stop_codon:yes gene_type:complete